MVAALTQYDRFGVFALLAATGAMRAVYLVLFVFLERASLRFGRLEPKLASIYDPYFWFHERHWKMGESPIAGLFPGTPFRPMIYRALGMKVGAKVFDCSRSVTERTLTEVGDYANLNEGCVLQAHSLEEGVFKSDYIRLGSGCSVGPGAFVHYGVTHGRSRRARCRLLPDEGRGARTSHRVARQPGEAGAQSRRRGAGRSVLRYMRRRDRVATDRTEARSRRCGEGRTQGRDGRQLASGRRPRTRSRAEDLVASNAESLAEARYDPDARPRAIYAGERSSAS